MVENKVTLHIGAESDVEKLQNELIRKNIVWYKHKDQLALASMGALVLLFCIAEFTFGIIADSLALISDAFHMLSDLIGLIIGFFAIQLSRRTADSKQSYGWVRAELIGGLVNGVFLAAVCFFIILEAIQRYIDPPDISEPMIVIIVGAAGLGVNLIGLLMFASHSSLSHGHSHSHGHGHGHGHGGKDKKKHIPGGKKKHKQSEDNAGEVLLKGRGEEEANCGDKGHEHEHEHDHNHKHNKDKKKKKHHDHDHKDEHNHEHHNEDQQEKSKKETKGNHNLHAVFLHVLGDALGSVGAIGTGLIIKYVNHPWKVYADPTFSLLLSLLILKSSIPLVRETANILLQSVPDSIEMDSLYSALMKVDGVVNIHELHVWQLNDQKNVATLHVAIRERADFPAIAATIKALFHRFGIHSTTIQPEYAQGLTVRSGCKMACEAECAPNMCCDSHAGPTNNAYGSL